ncbi:MAG: hypothetical protein ACT4TC_19405 [Myxococcaceae bacterium]
MIPTQRVLEISDDAMNGLIMFLGNFIALKMMEREGTGMVAAEEIDPRAILMLAAEASWFDALVGDAIKQAEAIVDYTRSENETANS